VKQADCSHENEGKLKKVRSNNHPSWRTVMPYGCRKRNAWYIREKVFFWMWERERFIRRPYQRTLPENRKQLQIVRDFTFGRRCHARGRELGKNVHADFKRRGGGATTRILSVAERRCFLSRGGSGGDQRGIQKGSVAVRWGVGRKSPATVFWGKKKRKGQPETGNLRK